MNKITLLLTTLLCLAILACAQAPVAPGMQVRHALHLHAGGAAFGIGPGYELQLSKPGGFTIGCALSLPLGHETRHRYYSPISVSPAINLMYGRRAWKMELSTEYNYFLEWGRSARGTRVSYPSHALAWLGGVRRQLPWAPLIFRANFGVSVVNLKRDAEILPAASLSLGYLIGSRQVAETALPPKPIFQFGHHLGPAYSGGRRTLQLQLAPTASFSIERPWQSVDHWSTNLWMAKYNFQFQTQWASQVGLMADLGNAGAIAGLRVGLAAGLRSVGLGWTSGFYGIYPNGNILLEGSETLIDELQMTWELNASLRLRTLQLQPWVVQVGAFTGDFRTLRSGSWYYSPIFHPYGGITPNSPRYGVGPMVSVSKQFALGTHAIEPYLSGKCNYHMFYRGPQLNQWSTTVGVMLWL